MTSPARHIGEGYISEMPIGFSKTVDGFYVGNKSTPFNNFLHSGGNVTGIFVEIPEDCFIYNMGLKVRSDSNPSNNCTVGMYDKVGLDAGSNLVMSPDVKSFGTSLTTLEFSFDYEPASFLQEKWLIMQCEFDYYFEYDNLSIPGYGFFGNKTFGLPDANPTGIGIFNNTLTMWIDCVTVVPGVGTVKKRLLLTGVGK